MGFTSSAIDTVGKNGGTLLILGGAALAVGSSISGVPSNPLPGIFPGGTGAALGGITVIVGGGIEILGGL